MKSLLRNLHLFGLSGLIFGETRREQKGSDPQRASSLFAVYVHYDPFGLVHRYVAEQVEALARAGFRVLFITHSRKLPKLNSVLSHCAKAVHRRNLGYDFGGYRYGLRWIRSLGTPPSAVLLMNDSCYGFFSSIEGIESHVGEGGVDLWGLTESFAHDYHLQSYFLLISRRLFEAPSFWKFWNRLPLHRSRNYVIRKGEIGLTQSLLPDGFRLGALVAYRDIAEDWLSRWRTRHGATRSEKVFVEKLENALILMRPVNPTHYFWEALLEDYRVPLLKRDLLSKNPVSVPGVQNAAMAVSKQGGDFSAALEHLRFKSR
jgi:lipopolysaccharide biosynthesis protein